MSKTLSRSEYWETVAEIDATIFCIEQLAEQQVMRKPIEKMIDKATGYDKEQTETLEYWSKRLKLLMKLLPPDDWHFKQIDLSPQLR